MAEEIMNTYHVAYERDESGWWVASVREVHGCHTQGRTVDEARRRIREAMELFVANARSAKLVDDVKLPATAAKAIRAYATLRKRADQEDRRAALAARRAVRLLRGGKLKMSARDAGRTRAESVLAGMVQRGERLRFPLEPRKPLRCQG
jgi:predicted RNase H-like HicB family nuclease